MRLKPCCEDLLDSERSAPERSLSGTRVDSSVVTDEALVITRAVNVPLRVLSLADRGTAVEPTSENPRQGLGPRARVRALGPVTMPTPVSSYHATLNTRSTEHRTVEDMKC